MYEFAGGCPTSSVDPSGLIERSLVPKPESGKYGQFNIKWKVSTSDSYDCDIILIQRIHVKVSLNPAGPKSQGTFKARNCEFTYFEEIGRLIVDPETKKTPKTPKDDTWACTGFPKVGFYYRKRLNTWQVRPTRGTVTMRGKVWAIKLTEPIKKIVDQWEEGQHYTDHKSACAGLTWTAGQFPSVEEFKLKLYKKDVVEEEEEKTITAEWGPPDFGTVLSGLEDKKDDKPGSKK